MIEQLHEVIREIEDQWSAKRVLVVGDVMLDKYVWGEVGRISPEAPVPVVRATHQSEQPGGAANVAMNIARLGAQAEVIGFAGGDEDEALLVSCLKENGIAAGFVASRGISDDHEAADSERAAADAAAGQRAHGRAAAGGFRQAGGAGAGAAAGVRCGGAFGLCEGRADAGGVPAR